ncbi:MAG: tetratricopeptide repeat protein [Rhodocyclaceae bacterium]|nr:tetratricopeptide repeat protein [Rhodocyclaceae bacterium]
MSKDFQQALQAAISLHQQGHLASAAQHYQALLQSHPGHPDLLHLLGVIAYQERRLDEAQTLIEQAITAHPKEAQYYSNLGNVLHDKQRFSDAVKAYVRAVGIDQQRGVDNPVVLCNLGNSLMSLGRFEEATAVMEKAYQLSPDDMAVTAGYARLLKVLKRYEEAINLFVSLLEKDPSSPALRTNLGNTLADAGLHAEALAQFSIVIDAHPDYLEPRYGRALALWNAGEITAALLQLQDCLDRDPMYANAHHAMVAILEGGTDLQATLAGFAQALHEHPRAQQLQSVLAYSTDFNPAMGAAEQQQVRKDWYAHQIVPLGIVPLALKVTPEPERKLRIGFIPGRFYRNASMYAYLPVLLQLDPSQFEIWCYDGFFHADQFTADIQARATGWCDIGRMSDVEVAHRIRDDRIDILIDLFAHAGANRLPIYAYKPAPIIVTAWGHANGTGMGCVDYLFSDPVSIPQEEVGLYAEHVHYLPCQLSFWLPENAPEISSLPMLKNGYVTFGCFNRMIKVSDAVLVLWAELMRRVPNSRLVLKAAELEEPSQRDRVTALFAHHGIEPSRLTFHGASSWFDHLERYMEIDFALDPFPMGGGVTTLDALWMGIPVLCLRGNTLGQRITSAIMTAIGLPEWVTQSSADYVDQAVRLANDPTTLSKLRRSLRMRMAASPLANPDYYVGCVADAFRAFWRQWCVDPHTRLPQPQEARFGVAAHAAEADRLWQDFLVDPDAPSVRSRLAASMYRAGKHVLAGTFSQHGHRD